MRQVGPKHGWSASWPCRAGGLYGPAGLLATCFLSLMICALPSGAAAEAGMDEGAQEDTVMTAHAG